MSKDSNIKLLDCTLRDGGYYNKWDFDLNIVDRYLKAVRASLVDVVELGFRSFPKNTFMGPFAYTTDEFINQLNLPKGPIYGVMINGSEFIGNTEGRNSAIDKVFQIEDKSPVSLVRIAINFNHVLESEEIAKKLKDMGYLVGLNMMKSHGKSERDYIEIAKKISAWNAVDVLYFADSLGNMIPKEVQTICQHLMKGWTGALGIHTHNNKNLALINSITAVENGVTWCDGTITGMGRGAGNVSTESLLLEMSRLGCHNGNASMTQPAVEDFTVLKNKYDWGSNLYYHYAANHNIHPTFVQNLLSNERYDNKQIIKALEFLSDRKSTSFSMETLHQSVYGNNDDSPPGSWNATSWLKGREVLIVGAGPSVEQYSKGILNYVERFNPAVIFLNINQNLPSSIATATVVSHETRALFDSNYYENLSHPIIMPKTRLGSLLKDKKKGLEILDYGLTLKDNNFIINSNGCILGWSLAAAYAFAVVTQSGAKKISLVGFDGYNADDLRQEEMNDVFNMYLSIKESLEIVTLTPSTYNIKHNSLFAPEQ